MKFLKITNVALAFILLVIVAGWLALGGWTAGGIAGLLLPAVAFSLAAWALFQPTPLPLRFSVWANSLLILVYFIVNAGMIFVLPIEAKNIAVIVGFQVMMVFIPAIANIAVAYSLKRRSRA
jgi:hypothetical protein